MKSVPCVNQSYRSRIILAGIVVQNTQNGEVFNNTVHT